LCGKTLAGNHNYSEEKKILKWIFSSETVVRSDLILPESDGRVSMRHAWSAT